MRVKQTYNILGATNTFFAPLQNVLAGAAFALNGNINRVDANGYQTQISFTSANNLSAVTFTITGISNGVTVVERRVGPNANTVTTANFFSSLISVTVSNNINQCSIGNSGIAAVPIKSNLGSDSFTTIGCWSVSIHNPDGANVDILGTHNYNPNVALLAGTTNQTFSIVAAVVANNYYIPPADTTILDAVILQITTGANALIINYISV